MGKEFPFEKVADSIKTCLSCGTDNYSCMPGPYGQSVRIMETNGDTQEPIMSISSDRTLTVYGREIPHKVDDSIRRGLEALGYELRFGNPVKVGRAFLYLVDGL